MSDKRKDKGRIHQAKCGAISASFENRAASKKKKVIKKLKVFLKQKSLDDWETLKGCGYSASVIFEQGIIASLNQLATKRVDECLYGEYEAYIMYKKRNGKYGIKLETRAIRAKITASAKTYVKVNIISLSPCPRGGDMVVIKYFKFKNKVIDRSKIFTIRKRVHHIDEKILLFFANGGNHSD